VDRGRNPLLDISLSNLPPPPTRKRLI